MGRRTIVIESRANMRFGRRTWMGGLFCAAAVWVPDIVFANARLEKLLGNPPASGLLIVQTVRDGRRLTLHLHPDLTYQLYDGGAASHAGTTG